MPKAAAFMLMSMSAALALGGGGCTSSGADGTLVSDLVEPLLPPTPGQAARDAFNVYDPDRRRNAVALLAASPFGGEDPYLRTYRLLIDDPDSTVRGAATQALGLHGKVDDVALILPRLKDDAPFVRWEAAKALQRIHNDAAINPLLETLRNDEDADVRLAAADALGQYATPAVFDALVGALIDRDYGVVSAAGNSLRTLTGYDGDNDPVTWLAWGEQRPGELFRNGRQYTYTPYQKPPGIMKKMQFWTDEPPAPRIAPEGLEAAAEPAGATNG